MDKRRQGRPKRGEAEVGYSFILENARQALQERPFDVSSRKDLAAAVGVTPALISYYFPKGVDVADLILSPVIAAHLQTLRQNFLSSASAEVKIRTAFRDLIEAFTHDKYLFEAYEILANTSQDDEYTLIGQMHEILDELVKGCQGTSVPSSPAVPVLHGAIWGMCKASADLRLAEMRHGTADSLRVKPQMTAQRRFAPVTPALRDLAAGRGP